MKAENTVMSDKEILAIDMSATNINGDYFLYTKRVAKAQAEISFKAGIKEVVDWIQQDGYLVDQRATNLGDIPVFLCHSEKWQAKLKEWCIDK